MLKSWDISLALNMTYFFIVFASVAKQSPGRVGFRKAYTISLWSWDISLALNMTYFFILRHSERSEESHRKTDRHILITLVVGYFACAQYDVKAQVGYFACAQYDVFFYFTSF